MIFINRYLWGAVFLLGVGLSIWGYGAFKFSAGADKIQTLWNTERSVNNALAAAELTRQEKILNDINAQYEKNIKLARSQAATAAVNDYILDHGLLLLKKRQTVIIANCPKEPNGSSTESGISPSLTEFVNKCGIDAIQIGLFQDWVKLIGFPTEE